MNWIGRRYNYRKWMIELLRGIDLPDISVNVLPSFIMNTSNHHRAGMLLSTLSLLFFLSSFVMPKPTDDTKRYKKVPLGYLMVLRQGDDLFVQLENLAKQEKIPSATLSGMGFVNATFGYFNQQTKEYDPKEFNDVELASLNGSIAWQDRAVSLHLHGVVTDKTFAAHGGHLLAATVGAGSVELLVTVHPHRLNRVKDPAIGANVLRLD
jgi:predicted DNA-binding protein with PD1-like motif